MSANWIDLDDARSDLLGFEAALDPSTREKQLLVLPVPTPRLVELHLVRSRGDNVIQAVSSYSRGDLQWQQSGDSLSNLHRQGPS